MCNYCERQTESKANKQLTSYRAKTILNTKFEVKSVISFGNELSIYVYEDDQFYLFGNTKINYCPMCGRQLNEKVF